MPAARVVIELSGRPDCTVRIGAHLLSSVGRDVSRLHPQAARAILVSDQEAGALYRPSVKTALTQAGLRALDITVPAGRDACSLACAEELWSAFAQSGIAPDTVLVALGGRSVCTIGLYAAAGYRGGMPCALVPTTTEAMVCTATLPAAAVDVPQAPAAATAVPQPSFACLSFDTLESQSREDAEAGYAEAVRASLMGNGDEFFQLSDTVPGVLSGDEESLVATFALANIARADALAQVPAVPPRAAANFGFRYGESLVAAAAACGYAQPGMRGRLLADGMRVEARLGVALGITPLELMAGQDDLFAQLGLDVVPGLPAPVDLVDAMAVEAGSSDGFLRLALPVNAGVFEMTDIDTALVQEHLEARAASLDGEG